MNEVRRGRIGVRPLAFGSLLITALAVGVQAWGPESGMVAAVSLGLFAVGGACFVVAVAVWTARLVTNSLSTKMEVLYRQTEALICIHGRMRFAATAPALRGWPVSPDFAVLAMRQVEYLNNVGSSTLVMECGSGASTIIIGTLLRDLGRGRLVSLESDGACYEDSKRNVLAHGLQDWVEIHHAPLIRHELHERPYPWYDVTSLNLLGKVNLLIVDGPRGDVSKLTRFPAVPVLLPWLERGCLVLVDDASRPDEREMIQRWMELELVNPVEMFATEAGASLVRVL